MESTKIVLLLRADPLFAHGSPVKSGIMPTVHSRICPKRPNAFSQERFTHGNYFFPVDTRGHNKLKMNYTKTAFWPISLLVLCVNDPRKRSQIPDFQYRKKIIGKKAMRLAYFTA